jgi:hypothetical protein
MPHVSQDDIEGIAKRALGTFGFEELFKRLKKGEQINEETMAAEEIIDELRRWDKVRYKDWTIVYVHPKKEEE